MPAEAGTAARQGDLRFTPGDVERFAAASGDGNPLHVDREFARRTPFGECIVHGALVALGMLGALPGDELTRVKALRAWFAGPIIPGAESRVTASPSRKHPGTWEIRLVGRGKPLARLVAGPDVKQIAPGLAGGAPGALDPAAHRVPMRTAPVGIAPQALRSGETIAGAYQPGEGLSAITARFGVDRLDRSLIEGLAWVSYVVGMELPGLHSLFSGLTLATIAGPSRAQAERYEVELRDHDQRTGQLGIGGVLADGAGSPLVAAKVECFVRAPTGPPDPAVLGLAGSAPGPTAAATDRGAVVVIGASRGFGAALSLALVARGYEVHGAHSSSSSSADELASLGGPRLHLHQLDARDPCQLGALAPAAGTRALAGLALNAALPPLPMGLTAESAGDLADYVAASIRLVAVPLGALLPFVSSEGGWVMFTSSSALSAPPRDWPHYIAAKAALEGLASWVAETSPRLRTVILRPPGMRTEMTNTPSGRIAPVATETIATWVADRLAHGGLPTGLSTLEPGTVAPR